MDILELAKTVIETEEKGMTALKGELNDNFIKAVNLLMSTKGRVIVTGMGKSGHIGRKMAATFASTGTPAFFVHPSEASHGDLGMLTPQDVLVAISNSGEVKELQDIVRYAQRFNIPMIAMTRNADSMLGRAADIVLALPSVAEAPEACPFGRAPTTSALLTLALGDALAVVLMRLKGFSEEAYHDRHPGGKLGALLARVEEVMAKGDDVPLVPLGTPMSEALIEMTKKSLGVLGIVDGNGFLVGVISDGDLRRHMEPTLLDKKVEDVMSLNPKTIHKDVLAVKAVHLMNESKITKIFVLDEGKKPIGCLSIHHCLTAGVV